MNNIMLDLETLGTSPGAAILAIGAVRFDDNGVKDKFAVSIKLPSLMDAGFRVDDDTFLFWMGQDPSAAKQFSRIRVDVGDALQMFADFAGRDAIVWGNGAAFDNVLLRTAYEMLGIRTPWKWSNDRCYRTIKNLCPDVALERVGTLHDAVDDATSQANHLLACLKTLTRREVTVATS
jgi:hypothetical protein